MMSDQSNKDVKQDETPRDTTMADQSNNTETPSAPPEQPNLEKKNERQNEAAAQPAVESTKKQTQKQAETLPYAYQHEPLEEQSHQQQQVQPEEGRGPPQTMGAPSNPDAHPANKEAAAGKLDSKDPYTQDPSTPAANTGKFFADVKEFSQQMEILVTHLWGHLRTGSSVGETALGRLNVGTRILAHGGFEGFFRAAFPSTDEKLKKTYACFLSTSTGPVDGTLFVSNKRLAFCSDRPLQYTPPTAAPAGAQGDARPAANGEKEGDKPRDAPAANGKKQGDKPRDAPAANGEKEGDKPSYFYYKVAVPIEKIREVVPSVNPNKAAEKYIEVITQDNFEFWFMGFVNYDKGVKTLQDALGTANQQE